MNEIKYTIDAVCADCGRKIGLSLLDVNEGDLESVYKTEIEPSQLSHTRPIKLIRNFPKKIQALRGSSICRGYFAIIMVRSFQARFKNVDSINEIGKKEMRRREFKACGTVWNVRCKPCDTIIGVSDANADEDVAGSLVDIYRCIAHITSHTMHGTITVELKRAIVRDAQVQESVE